MKNKVLLFQDLVSDERFEVRKVCELIRKRE